MHYFANILRNVSATFTNSRKPIIVILLVYILFRVKNRQLLVELQSLRVRICSIAFRIAEDKYGNVDTSCWPRNHFNYCWQVSISCVCVCDLMFFGLLYGRFFVQ